MITYSSLGHPEDWSTKVFNARNGKTVFVIDTGGRFQLVRNLELYTLTGRTDGLPSLDQFGAAIRRAVDEVRL